MNLIDVTKQFPTDDECLKYIEQMRWPDGVVRCPTCGGDKISKITRTNVRKDADAKKKTNVRKGVFQCLEKTCKQQFSATSGTIFNDSHLPLHKWFMALAIVVDAKKSISANQLKTHLGIGSYRTAWYLAHRIRKAMAEEDGPFSQLRGIVEVDETYIGGKTKRRLDAQKKTNVPALRSSIWFSVCVSVAGASSTFTFPMATRPRSAKQLRSTLYRIQTVSKPIQRRSITSPSMLRWP
jgi:Transposase zinc-ribbon domain